ncbi:MAG: DUF1552 domain-containing protein [Proteobacteria bacterium]|nr:MAG: DUF1552 domain-containing protein [Pseudomonadota bacterium]
MQRRKFLKGVGGVVFALPFLEGMWAETGMAAENDPGRFAIFMRQANGVVQPRFWPSATGTLTAQTMGTDKAVSALQDYMAKLIILKGISHPFANEGCDHAYGGAQALTAAKPQKGNPVNRTRAMGESIDNMIARILTPGIEPLTLLAGNKGGYLDDVLSYRGSTDLRGAEQSPYAVYQRMFGMSTSTAGNPIAMRKSVNDFVRDQMKALMASPRLSKSDVERLELHQSSIRDVENSISSSLPDAKVAEMQKMSNSNAYGNSLFEVVKLHADLIGIAIASGQVRAATLQVGSGNDSTSYEIDGQRLPGYHRISHRVDSDGSDGPAIAGAEDMHAKIDVLHSKMFKYLLDVLNGYKFDGKPLLDFGASVWLNDLADGPSHSHNNIPHVIAGSCNGALKTGVYLDTKVQNNKFLNSIGTAVGLKNGEGPLDNFGDSSLAKGLIDAIMT